MTLSKIGRLALALVASAALGLGMTACGGGTIGYMWVLGTFYNQITGFKIDDFTGNLTTVLNSPFSSAGSNPQMLAVKPGGRFLYVVNQGTGQVDVPGTKDYVAPTGSSIAQFSVGGSGILTYQQSFFSQGTAPIWITFDSTGNYLYVLDKYSADYATTGNGAITAFSVASDTGNLTLIQNTTILNPNNTPTNYFEVGPNPSMTKIGSGSCLYTLSPNSIYPYVVSSATGQLTVATTGPLVIPSTRLTSINTSVGTTAGSFTYLTDGGSNQIYSFQSAGTGCTLSPIPNSQQSNVAANTVPVNSLTSNNGKFLYVINQTTTASPSTSTQQSSISAFNIVTGTGQLTTLADGTSNPYAVGSGPVCIVEDPSNKYIYTSNFTDSTVTGKLFDPNLGRLAGLQRGSTFPVTQNPTCMVVSGNVQ